MLALMAGSLGVLTALAVLVSRPPLPSWSLGEAAVRTANAFGTNPRHGDYLWRGGLVIADGVGQSWTTEAEAAWKA